MSQQLTELLVRYDLHSHTTASDGELTPEELVERAAEMGINFLAITDHDTCAALPIAQQHIVDKQLPMGLITGVEISTLWENMEIHVVGLNFDLNSPAICQLLELQSTRRYQRGEEIGQRLAKSGIENCWENAQRLAQGGQVTRAHFAKYLIEIGKEKTINKVFKRYLAKGKTGYVPPTWCSIEEAIAAIHQAGGVAVLAHPSKYQLSTKWLKRLVDYFKQQGGDAMEVSHCQQTHQEKQFLSQLAEFHQLKCSLGSDFHRPCGWIELGRNLWLPNDNNAVWQLWDNTDNNNALLSAQVSVE
ncbi:PHP domain-containing protein [Moellerella wisconsensis]|uniref:RNase RNM n=1 Tax=Moellerella wisconsensis TaxID=158849 RepID=UPI0025AF33A9|nr:PHP domain-containing protein [Moellerella wisconsensis]WJW80609.1 PHP domain-containing protein [Moellerella wisconsensis]